MIRQIIQTSLQNFKKYFLAQIKIFIIILLFFVVSLNLLRIDHAMMIGISISILDLLPVLGSGLIFLPWSIYHWLWGSPDLAWKLALVYVLSLIIKQFLEPIFIGKDLALPFYVPLVITLVCGIVFNVFGMIVAAILIPVVSAIYQVINQLKQEEPQGR